MPSPRGHPHAELPHPSSRTKRGDDEHDRADTHAALKIGEARAMMKETD
jgi:hypothetical protein